MTQDDDEARLRRLRHDDAERAVFALLRQEAVADSHVDGDGEPLQRVWHEMEALRRSDNYAALLGRPTMRERLVALQGQLSSGKWRIAWPALPIAATAALAFYVVVPHPAHFTTEAQPRDIVLADRSSVALAPASRLDFEIAGGTRQASLVGDAQFSVAHDADHPFLVKVGDAQVRVVGTRFRLSYRKACTQLSVLSGTVDINSPSMPTRRLSAGEETVTVDNGQSYRLCTDASGNGAPPRWSYVDAPLATVIADAGRFSPRRIVIRAPEIAAERVTMAFTSADIEKIVDLIPQIVSARIVYGRDNVIYIDRRR